MISPNRLVILPLGATVRAPWPLLTAAAIAAVAPGALPDAGMGAVEGVATGAGAGVGVGIATPGKGEPGFATGFGATGAGV